MLSRLKRDLTMAEAARAPGGARVDLLLVADMVAPGAKVLDVGSGDGELLRILGEQRGVDGRGIELSREGVNECVAKGLAVIQGDADTDLADYPDDAFDYVILSQTLQATRQPRVVLEHMLRIGRNAVVSFPNFGHWKIRLQLVLRRPHAEHRQSALCVVGFAQHPLLHHQGLRRALRRHRRQDGARRGVQRLGHAAALQCAVVVLEPVRRAGGVPAEPAGLRNEVPGLRVRWVWSSGRSTIRRIVETDIPARLDRLPWSRFHTLVVAALGITWILDGLEVTLAGSVAGALKASPVLQFSNADVGLAASAYLAGAVLGALFFGWLTDRLGRKKLFFITLVVYLVATAATALSWNFWSFALFRFLTGAGIGGEYAAINSTIQELIPARVRGWTDLVVNGSFWIGAALGALGAIVLLDPAVIDPEYGWRLCFGSAPRWRW